MAYTVTQILPAASQNFYQMRSGDSMVAKSSSCQVIS